MKRIALVLASICFAGSAHAADPLLESAAAFTGQIFHLSTGVPGVVIAAVRDGESAVYGFGETEKGNGTEPDADTRIAVASITKSFTGLVMASLVADGTIALTDPAGPHVKLVDALPERDGHTIRFVDLATHASGLGRELEPVPGAEKYTDAAFAANLVDGALLFAPGTGISYSNIGFDVLGMALSGAAGMPYADLMQARVLDPLGLSATGYNVPRGENAFTGYDWNGNAMAVEQPISNRFGASSLTTTPRDMVGYLEWNLDRFGVEGAEARAISHAAHLIRDGLDPVFGLDESGRMDAMGLGWVIMMPEGNRPLIIQKAGGTNGIFSYIAFAPTRGVGVFMAINQFDFAAGMEMATVANDLIAALAPR
ncbi:D-alanyl-D-alanine-carboxypeptidase/endopeptidase AmpH [Acuticoccus sp. MNP-M23]|uniref:D-alanyl-D-alanine- carboxypeptidase/endopeptidase AmpH n=1 Tax=Acuticoccus sp. MNP-M23 TaxID=3072793 RepID=UPI00281619DF|nr:D-alanyl-D-alanine-carboxypeptidase/endopeptidase AmpH [Acuticoccus sp. MNP-M23]WMS43087.1 D-alanyl-D-alanine-carboxypeptidase/endopeptidase AmpH [Acuticoccus sp. MNP-M23]